MIGIEAIMDVLRTIPDPEMPISIVDLGLVENVRIDDANGQATIWIDILPTFVGCPALEMIAASITEKDSTLALLSGYTSITEKVSAVDGVRRTNVRFINDPAWSVDRISSQGRASLKTHGVTVPASGATLPVPGHEGGGVQLRVSAVKCPFCDSDQTTLESMFGPTRCRMIFYCSACRNTFEHMKKV